MTTSRKWHARIVASRRWSAVLLLILLVGGGSIWVITKRAKAPTPKGHDAAAEAEHERKELTRVGATPFERFRAMVRLAERFDPVARAEALRRLTDSDVSIRAGAARALGYFDDDEALKALISMFNDKDESVRVAAVEALGSFPSVKREPTFDMLLRTRTLPDSVRIAACTAVLRGDQRANSREMATMTLVRMSREGLEESRVRAANQLIFLVPGHEEARKALLEHVATGTNPEITSNALFHFAQQKEAAVLQLLPTLAKHKERKVRMTLIRVLRFACPKDAEALFATAAGTDAALLTLAKTEAAAVKQGCRR